MKSGTTLIEILVSVLVFTIAFSALGYFFSGFEILQARENKKNEEFLFAIEEMEFSIRNLEYCNDTLLIKQQGNFTITKKITPNQLSSNIAEVQVNTKNFQFKREVVCPKSIEDLH